MTTYEYHNSLIERVIDGDTYEAVLDLGFHIHKKTTLRLHGVDTPEIRAMHGDYVEKRKGLKAKAYVKKLIEGKRFTVFVYDQGKYGRWISDISLDVAGKEIPLSKHLLAKGLAVPL